MSSGICWHSPVYQASVNLAPGVGATVEQAILILIWMIRAVSEQTANIHADLGGLSLTSSPACVPWHL